jgi:hypothetical protein
MTPDTITWDDLRIILGSLRTLHDLDLLSGDPDRDEAGLGALAQSRLAKAGAWEPKEIRGNWTSSRWSSDKICWLLRSEIASLPWMRLLVFRIQILAKRAAAARDAMDQLMLALDDDESVNHEQTQMRRAA